jgi:hypothetical protein
VTPEALGLLPQLQLWIFGGAGPFRIYTLLQSRAAMLAAVPELSASLVRSPEVQTLFSPVNNLLKVSVKKF